MIGLAQGGAPHGAIEDVGRASAVSAFAFMPGAPIFFTADIEVYQPGVATPSADFGHGGAPHGALALTIAPLESTTTLRASDLGYRSRDTDPGGLLVYPPALQQAFEIDRLIALDPSSASNRAYGAIRINNVGGRYDAFVQTRNADNRPASIRIGQKGWDPGRLIQTDPPFASLRPFFGGFALPWSLTEEELTVPLADPASWLDRPIQSSLYAGTGGLEGGADLAGKPRPMTRGGTAALPVRDVPLVQVDAVNLIYQWTDGVGTLAALYEGGAAVFTYDGDVPDLYAGTVPAPGHFRTNRGRGLLQLGSKPVRTLTADVTGAFPLSGLVASPGALARCLMIEDMGLPSELLDLTSFNDAASVYPYPSGYYVGTEAVQGAAQVAFVLGSIGARLCGSRAGQLRAYVLAPSPAGTVPIGRLDTTTAVSVVPQALPAALDPPPYRWRVGYGRTWQTLATGDLNGATTAARQQQLAVQDRYGSWVGSAVRAAWRRPNDPDPIGTVLLRQADATEVASRLGGLFASRPGLYAVTIPVEAAAPLDLGSAVLLGWPLQDLRGGRIGQVVGEQIRSGDGQATLTILVA